MARNPVFGRALNRLQEVTGFSVVDTEYLRTQEAVAREAYQLANDLEEIGYVSMNYLAGRPADAAPVTRRRWAQQARMVWQTDPQAGASVEMLGEFTFGRGVARPRFKDKEAQEVVDEAWDDPQNQRVLTSFLAQMKLSNSLSVQSNVFYEVFDEGDDGKVKLSFLSHDTVRDAVPDPEVRQRPLFYTAAKTYQEWDYKLNALKPVGQTPKIFYYESWSGVEEALQDRGFDPDDAKELLTKYRASAESTQKADPDEAGDLIKPGEPYVVKCPSGEELTLPPPNMLGDGKVYHVTDGNLDMEMIFAIPRMRRTMRWYAAYNDFMAARVSMMQAAASFIMTKTVEGSPVALERLAAKGLRATSDLRGAVSSAVGPGDVKAGPMPGSILSSTGNVKFEPLKLDSGAGNAQTDAQMIRAQVSAGDRFPQHYLGDVGSANLATATSMELPVLKHVEARQELIEGLFRWFIDRVIERAVETGRLDPNVSTEPDDNADLDVPKLIRTDTDDAEDAAVLGEGVIEESREMLWRINREDVWRETRILTYPDGHFEYLLAAPVEEAHEDKNDDEEDTGRDLSYEFGLPSPLRRMMTDLVAAAVQVATMADPNGINVELTRVMLTFIFSEAFEMQDASDLVDRIFPKGYDPMAALQAAQGGPPGAQGPGAPAGTNFFGPGASDLPANPANAYGAPNQATSPENVPGMQEALDSLPESVALRVREALQGGNGDEGDWDVAPIIAVGRHGGPVYLPGKPHGGARTGRVPMRTNGRVAGIERSFERTMRGASMEAIAEMDMDRIGGSNGHGGK